MVTVKDYAGIEPTWCKGCSNFQILKSLNQALVNLGIEPHQVLLVSGIGDAGKLPHYSKGNIFHALHGRHIPVAIGARLAYPELKVLAIGGDGDTYGEGVNHLIHALRRNFEITCLVHNNQVYGLTKGQASPTSDPGFETTTTPQGAGPAINPIALAIGSGASFVSRGFAGDSEHLTDLLQQAITFPGFALVDILQPCISFNPKNTFKWFRERVYRIDEDGGHDPTDKKAALDKSSEWEERIPIGVIYREEKPLFEWHILEKGDTPLVKQEISTEPAEKLLGEFY
jgi:2-oxoglutarate ferredoxin oxidoreductase subunit beta